MHKIVAQQEVNILATCIATAVKSAPKILIVIKFRRNKSENRKKKRVTTRDTLGTGELQKNI